MATIRPIIAERTIDTGSIPGTQIDDSIGQGLRAAGAAVANMGATLHEIDMRRERMRNQAEEFKADQSFRRFEDDNALLFDKTKQNIDPSGEGFTATISKQITERSDQFLKTLPASLRPKFAEIATTAREEWLNKASRAEIDQRNTWYRDGIQKTLEGRQTQVFNDPSLFDAAKSDGYRAIDASGLPETEKKALKEKWDETLSITLGEREVRDAEADPSSADGAASRLGVGPSVPLPKAVHDRATLARDHFVKLGYTPEQAAGIVGNLVQESGVRSDGPSGDSGTAHGIAQWRGARFAKLQRFAASRGRDWRDFNTQLDFIDVELQQDEPAAYARLKKAKTIDDATAAFIGFERPQGWTAANPRAGHGWANRLAAAQRTAGVEVTASGPVEVDPRYAGLSLDKRLEIYDRTMAAAQRGQTALDAQAKADYQATKGSMELGIQTGDLSSPQQIMKSSMTDGDKATLLKALQTKQGEAMATGEAVRLFSEGNLRVDPYDEKGRKTVNSAWDAVAKSAPPEQLQATAEEMVRQTGVVPQSVVNQIRQGLTSRDVDAVMQAAQLAQRLSTVDPAALGRASGGTEAQKAADDFGFYVNRLNLSPEDAARRLAENRDPEKQRDRKAIEPAAKEFVKSMQDLDLASQFDDSFLGLSSNPTLGMTPAQELGIKADFLAIAEDEFYRANGDPELAQNRAVEQMKRIYGVTEFGGVKAVVKHPPEKYWPVSTLGMEQEPGRIAGSGGQGPGTEMGALSPFGASMMTPTLDYARKQLETDVSGMGLNADPSTIQLVTTPETDAMVKRGELPAYGILYKDKDGMYQTIPGKLWRPDLTEAIKANEADEQRRIDDARAAQEAIENRSSFWRIPTRDEWGHALRLEVPGPGHTLTEQQKERDARAPKPVPKKPATPANQIQDQRSQLFQNAEDAGTLSPQGVLSGNDDIFGER